MTCLIGRMGFRAGNAELRFALGTTPELPDSAPMKLQRTAAARATRLDQKVRSLGVGHEGTHSKGRTGNKLGGAPLPTGEGVAQSTVQWPASNDLRPYRNSLAEAPAT